MAANGVIPRLTSPVTRITPLIDTRLAIPGLVSHRRLGETPRPECSSVPLCVSGFRVDRHRCLTEADRHPIVCIHQPDCDRQVDQFLVVEVCRYRRVCAVGRTRSRYPRYGLRPRQGGPLAAVE